MTHDESCRRVDCKNSSADANVWTKYPCELRRLLVAARTDASSSITEITESVDKMDFPDAEQGARPQPKDGLSTGILKAYLGLYALGLVATNSKRFGLFYQIG